MPLPTLENMANLNRTENSTTDLPYMPQLDGLRALAVTAVYVYHFGGNLPFGLWHLNWGLAGVRLFFVLSGFLITGILLRGRQRIESGQDSPWRVIRGFYIRRFLRIFPLYYFVIAVAAIVGVSHLAEAQQWLLTYTTNIYIAIHGYWIKWFSHFWTLAIEEQFYLVWPWLVIFSPRRTTVPMLLGLIALGPIYRAAAMAAGLNHLAVRFLTIAWLDSLAMGALLAVLLSSVHQQRTERVLNRIALPTVAGILALLMCLPDYPNFNSSIIWLDVLMALFFCWLICRASRGFAGIFGKFLSCKPMVYLGKISYGLYVYQAFPRRLLPALFRWSGNAGMWHQVTLRPVVYLLTTFVLATLSWHLFEGPINRLKRYVNYRRSDGEAVPVVPVEEILESTRCA